MSRYGYIRLENADPDISRQALQLDTIGGFDRLFVERLENKSQWTQRDRLTALLQPGDQVYAASADRVCDSLKGFLNWVGTVLEKDAHLILLEEGLDSRTPSGQKTLRLLTTFARIDFENQSGRKKAGIEIARRSGRRIGRPPVSVPAGFREICRDWSQGKISGPEAVRRSGLKQTSFYKKAAELGYKPQKPNQPKTTPP